MRKNYTPSLRRQKNSPYWQAVLRLPSGQRTNRSTKKTRKPEALKEAARMQRELEAECCA